ncbi:MAG: copper resistance protein CopC/CopD [Gemmatimonadaceae bacterium]|nr:copper resistance protein CopC/CopD [Gemmatimonadaceae bacterium]
MKSSEPSGNAHLSVAPREIRLEFSEAAELAFTRINLVGQDSASVSLGALRTAPDNPRAVVAMIDGQLASGEYSVMWQMAGADGHPTRGKFSFVIAPGAMGLPQSLMPIGAESTEHHRAAEMPQGTDFGSESFAYVFLRWLQFTAMLIIFGAIAFRFGVINLLGRKQSEPAMITEAARAAARLGHIAAAVLVVTLVLRLYAQSYAMHGANDAFNTGLVGGMLRHTLWGFGWITQLVALILAGVGFHMARMADTESRWWLLAACGGVLLAFTPALSGHAASLPRFSTLAIVADAIHVMGAGGWLGSLLMVVIAGIPAAMRLEESRKGPAVATIVNAFSPTALVFAGIVALTGLFAAWMHVGAIQALWGSQYGKTLLLKLGILSVVALTGAYNWKVVQPRLGSIEGGQKIRRSASVELGVGLLVIAVTAVLVATPTPMDEKSMTTTSIAAP